MKIYLFNPETGIYVGEDFADKILGPQGALAIPPDATEIAPPLVEPGQILVFNDQLQRWDVCEGPAPARKSSYDKLASEVSS